MSFDLARLSTVQLVPPTPFSSDGKVVRTDVLAAFARQMYDAGIRAFLPGAGTGEFHSLSADEVIATVATVRQSVGSDAVVMAPIGLGVSHAIAIGEGAISAGADALLVMPPIHPYLCDSGVRDYFQTLMDALPLPFLAYKKGPTPSDALLTELGREGRLVGVKYAVNEIDAVTRFIDANRAHLGVYCGTAERFAPFFHLAGATGYTSGAGNIAPRLTLAIHAALTLGDYPRAMALLKILRPIEDFRAKAGDSYNISMLKVVLKHLGHDFGPPRAPQRRLNEAEQAEVIALIEPIVEADREID